MIRAVCFDLGGVVVRIARSWAEACAAAGLDVRDPHAFAAPDMQSGRRELSDGYQLGRISCDEYFELISRSSNGLYAVHEVEAVHRAWLFDPYPGVEQLVDDLNKRNLHTACLSNTNHSHWQDLIREVRTPAIAKLRTRMVSHELGAVKPDVRIYKMAERIIEALPSEIVFFDDLAENVEAARSCGWHAFEIDHAGDTAAQMRSYLQRMGVFGEA